MSDGPHRSLPLRPGWRRVAETADNKASTPDEIAERVPAALNEDWNQEVPRRLVTGTRKILTDTQGTLFATDKMEQLQALRPDCAGAPLGAVLLDHAVEVAAAGMNGPEAMVKAVEGALIDRAANSCRQVEEHYYRETSLQRSGNVRKRIEDGIRQAPINALAHSLSGYSAGPGVMRPKKRPGLDEGVEL